MHHIFEFDDIIYAVLQHVKSSGTDLVNVAMTCSRLADSALNILWSEQSSLVPLIMCLPQDTWEVRENGLGHIVHFSRDPTPIEWERLRVNASRVRRLVGPNGFTDALKLPLGESFIPGLDVSRDVLQRLFVWSRPATLFPNLCELYFDAVFYFLEYDSSKSWLLRQFISPGLQALRFDVAGIPPHKSEQLLATLHAEVHGLRQLTVSADDGNMALTVPPSFGKLPKLIGLAIFGIDVCLTRQTIANIQQARCLQSLKLKLFGTSCDAGGIPLELPSLKTLHLSGGSLPQCTHFLRQVTTPQLSHIDIRYCGAASPAEMTAFIESLSTSCQTVGCLERVHVVDESKIPDPRVIIPLSSEIFRPLFKFNRLLSVKFIGVGNFNLDDGFLYDVPVAWPSIRELKLTSWKRRAIYSVTFTAMMSLASRCRSLQTLHLTVDATQSTIIPRAPDGTEELWPTQTALRNLHLGYSKVSEVARVPYFLAEVFPTLFDFKWYDYYYGNYHNPDIAIVSALSALNDALQQLWALRKSTGADDLNGRRIQTTVGREEWRFHRNVIDCYKYLH
ncbi:uncharacterized protein F5891DRAFT_1034603 [Suillus fuscotomentosus]|uniref:F-box domain-containing protein n=1 Tax=Suillus fuscotomentosus TaxID=1912939 RepID=A0AAD4HJQ5_9AGAM|nr:uncharacterized protein F5891DRAFT_1034603 [Suillus fuscotomentosus]KAG1900195.1 hypothetical protein F5891DRAFT_1034603 [Suillus fuscotomentosus]